MNNPVIRSNKKGLPLYFNVLFIAFVILLIALGPILHPDSAGYIDMHVIRGPFYPIWINFFHVIFGDVFYITIAAYAQIILNVFVIYYFIGYIRKKFGISDFASFFIIIISFYLIFSFSRSISTESLAIPLYLMLFTLFLTYETNSKKSTFYGILLVLLILINVRSQFLFLFPVIILCYVIKAIVNRSYRGLVFKISLILLTFISSLLVDRIYHRVVHGEFISTPFTGLQVVTDAFYVAQKDDYIYFDDTQRREIVKSILNDGYLKGAIKISNTEDILGIKKSGISHYNESYNTLSHRVIKQNFLEKLSNKSEVETWKIIDKETLEIAKVLIDHNLISYLKIQFEDILYNGANGYINFLFYLYLLTLFVILFINRIDLLSFIGIFILFSIFANLILVSIAEPVLHRYAMYNEYLLVVFLIAILDKNLKIERKHISGFYF